MRRRRSSSDGKNEPVRSLGIRSSRSPTWLINVRGREPLRCAVRVSVRSCGAAPITAVSSASISSWYSVCVAVRTRSLTSASFSAVKSRGVVFDG